MIDPWGIGTIPVISRFYPGVGIEDFAVQRANGIVKLIIAGQSCAEIRIGLLYVVLIVIVGPGFTEACIQQVRHLVFWNVPLDSFDEIDVRLVMGAAYDNGLVACFPEIIGNGALTGG